MRNTTTKRTNALSNTKSRARLGVIDPPSPCSTRAVGGAHGMITDSTTLKSNRTSEEWAAAKARKAVAK